MLARERSQLRQSDVAQLGRKVRGLLRESDSPGGDPSGFPERIVVRVTGRVYFVNVADIEWCEASGNYVGLHVGPRTHLIHDTLANIEQTLDARTFLRIHRSTIVNVTRIKELQPFTNGEFVVILHDGTRLKQIPAGGYVMGSIAMKDGFAYYGHYNKQVVSIDIAKGSEQWAFEDRQFEYFSTPALTDQLAIIGGRDRQLHFINRADGTRTGSFSARGRIDSSPVVIGDKVVVGSDDGRLYMVGLEDQEEIWSYEIGDTITSSPAVIDGMVVVGSQDGSVYAFGEKKN